MSNPAIQPQLDGTVPAPKVTPARRRMDDYEEWVDEVTPAYEEFADLGVPFTIDEVARKRNLPDPPHPKSQWGSLPARLQDAGTIRHHGYGGSERARHSLVHVWIGVPASMREMVARHRREERAARRAARNGRAAA